MMHMIKKQPSTVSPLFIILPTVLVTPIAPSPMTIIVSRLMRSIKCVFLKLSMRQKLEMAITPIDSRAIMIYQTIYTNRFDVSSVLKAGVMAANTQAAMA